MQVAESKGLPKLKHHLLPRTKGFWVTVQNLRGTGECPWSGQIRPPVDASCVSVSGKGCRRLQIKWAAQLTAAVCFALSSCSCLWFHAELQRQRITEPARHSQREEISRGPVCEVQRNVSLSGLPHFISHFLSSSERFDFLSDLQEDPSRADPRGWSRVCCLAPQALPGKGWCVRKVGVSERYKVSQRGLFKAVTTKISMA